VARRHAAAGAALPRHARASASAEAARGHGVRRGGAKLGRSCGVVNGGRGVVAGRSALSSARCRAVRAGERGKEQERRKEKGKKKKGKKRKQGRKERRGGAASARFAATVTSVRRDTRG
jgi:hypothetical protein